MSVYALSVLGALMSLALIAEMLRRRSLREKYAVLWLAVGLGVLIIGLFPAVLHAASGVLGVSVPANLLFFVAGLVLLAVSVQQSAEISALEEETRTLAEEVALLRLEMSELRPAAPPSADLRSGGPRFDETSQ